MKKRPFDSFGDHQSRNHKALPQAVQAKLNLHDLAEDLPTNWEQIPALAERAYAAYRELEVKQALLKIAEV